MEVNLTTYLKHQERNRENRPRGFEDIRVKQNVADALKNGKKKNMKTVYPTTKFAGAIVKHYGYKHQWRDIILISFKILTKFLKDGSFWHESVYDRSKNNMCALQKLMDRTIFDSLHAG